MAKRSTPKPRAHTATGKEVNAAQLASAGRDAFEAMKRRTEEGHRRAGRVPRRIDDSLRDVAPSVTEDEKLLQHPAPTVDFTHTDPWRVLRITGEFIEGFDTLASVDRAVTIF